MIARITIKLDCNEHSRREFRFPIPEATADVASDFYNPSICLAVVKSLVEYSKDWNLAEGVDDTFSIQCEVLP